MSTVEKSRRLTREEIARREIGITTISPGLAWLVSIVFLLTLVIPPTAQLIDDLSHRSPGGTTSCTEILYSFPDVADEFSHADGSLWNRILSANRRLLRNIEIYEQQLEERSLLTRQLLGPTQSWLTGFADVGNEKAYIGRNGWLFYRPDVDYVTGPGFLEPAVLHRRGLSGKQHVAPPQPDPRPAIIEFHEQLARRGIRLIVMPMPGKPAIHPDKLSSRENAAEGPLANKSFGRLCNELDAAGVLVFDPAAVMQDRKRFADSGELFLHTDTHWAPATVTVIANELRSFIERHCPLPPRPPVEFTERPREVENLGDIAAMLHLPEDQSLFPRERATIREVVAPDGQSWMPDETADVLLLGDSYTNIYSLPEMNWGSAAGLAERLSFALRRPLDRLAQNDGGSHAVRQSLQQQLVQGHDRLKGKRIVIWEFAVRELAFGDWKRFPMPEPSLEPDPSPSRSSSSSSNATLVRATVQAAAGAPQPGSVPYRDAVTGLHLLGVEGLHDAFPYSEIVVYTWGLKGDRLQTAARFSRGQTVTLRLTPWSAVREKYERFNRIELEDPDFRLIELPTYWAEEE